jgi:hypothetical protein
MSLKREPGTLMKRWMARESHHHRRKQIHNTSANRKALAEHESWLGVTAVQNCC